MNKHFLSAVTFLVAGAAFAADVPRESAADYRVRYATYNPEQVVVLKVRPGVVTRIVLEADEKITVAGTGLSARCDDENAQWCIKAEKDANQIWIKPYPGARFNNLELSTNKRDYSFKLDVENVAYYRIVMQYPIAELPMPEAVRSSLAGLAKTGTVAAFEPLTAAELDAKIAQRMRNTNYMIQFGASGEELAPSLIYDDGRYTYFQFPKGREVPAIFAVAADGQEVRVNFHMDHDLIVVQRTARKFFLRLGESVAAVMNDGWDPEGVATDSGVTDGVGVREVLQ